MKNKQFSTAKTKQYISTRRRISWFLSVLFILTQYGPQTLVMAAPQLFATPTAGVSRAPLGVARFNAPGFGDLEDAVNLATGNVYAAVEGVSRNNLTNTPTTPSPTNPGDETANSMGGKWQVTPRMRLYGFDSNLITENAPSSGYWSDYFQRPNSITYTMGTSDGGCSANYSGLLRPESASLGTYKVSFMARTASGGTLPITYGINDYNVASATLNSNWQFISSTFNVQTDQGRLLQIYENVAGNPSWEIGSIVVERTSSNTGNLMVTQDVSNPYYSGFCNKPAITATRDSGLFMSADYPSGPGANYSGVIRVENIPTGTYTVSFKGRSYGSNLAINYGLTDTYSRGETLTPQWQRFSTQFTTTGTEGRRFEIFETTKTNVPWEISEVEVHAKSTVQTSYNLGTGDGTTTTFTQVTPANNTWFLDKPTWINRYKGPSDASPVLPGVVLYQLQSVPGRQYSSEYLVRVPVGSGQGFAVHHYAQDGSRTTFYSDGEYADFTQNLSQQYRSAVAADPEGIAAASPKTQLTYTNVNSGQISKIKDEWGRASVYVWNGDNTLQTIYHLLRNENDTSTWTRLTGFAYSTINNERVITYMGYLAYDGIGNTASNIQGRWFGFDYVTQNGRTLLSAVRRPTLSKEMSTGLGTGGKGWRTTSYTYNTESKITQVSETGKPNIMYTYGTSSDYKGPMVTVIQCSTLTTTSCPADDNRKQSEYQFDVFGRLRKQRIRDYNPFVASHTAWFSHNGAAEKWRETSYSYYKNGNTALIIEPSGKTTHYIYDSRQNLIRTAVYTTNPFDPSYVVPVIVKLEGNFKFLKDQTATFTARVRDAANAGVKWQIKQGATVVWDSDVNPWGNGYAAGPTYASGTDADFKTYTLTFGTPGSFYYNKDTQYTIVATSKTDARQFSDLNYVVTPKISAVNLTLPTRLIVVPGCVEGGGTSYQCPPGISRTEVNIFGSLTPTPGFSINDYRISGTVTAVAGASPQAPTLTPSQFTVTTRSSSIAVQPPAWNTSLQGHSYTLSVTAASVEDPTVTTGNFSLVVNYMGIITSPMYRDSRFPGGKGTWNSYLSTSTYQHEASIMNPPTTSSLGITWTASSGGYFSSTKNGCFKSGDMGIFDGSKPVVITASVTQYPQVSMSYSDVEFFTAWDNFNGCVMSEVNPNSGYFNYIFGEGVTSLNSNGNQIRSLHSQSAPNATGASGSQATNNSAQAFQTDTTDEPEFPSDVKAGYTRDSQVSYNLDNMPNVQNQPAVGSYGAVTQTHAYVYNSSSIGGQTFSMVAQHRTTTNVGGADKRNTLEEYDTKGRLLQVTRTAGAVVSTRAFNYTNDGTQTFNVYSPNPIGATNAGKRSATNEPIAYQYGDLPNQIFVNGEGTEYKYDMLGNVVWESCYSCYTKNISRAGDGTLTATDFHRAIYRTFNGYGQQVWNAVVSHDGNPLGTNDTLESVKLTRYYSTGEIDASFDGSAKNLTVYQYDENPASTNFGRFWKVKKGPDDDGNGVLDSEREITDVSYDWYGRVSSSGTNGLVTTYSYDTLDRFTQSDSGAPENRFVYRTYSASGTPDFDCTGTGVISNPLNYCQYKYLDSLGRVTAIGHSTNVAQSDSGAIQWSEYTTYDAFDRPLTSTDERLEMNGTADDRMTKMKYDDEGRLLMLVGPKLRTKTGNGYTDGRRSAVAYTYDDLGRKTKEAVALNGTYDINASIPDSDAAINTYTYNNWDRVVSSVDPRGFTSTMKYDELGNVIEQKRQVSGTTYAITNTAYDAMSRPTMLIDPLGKISKNVYDAMGNKTQFKDARDITTKVYAYTGDGLLERVYEPVIQVGATNAVVGAGLDPNTLAKYNMTKRYKYSGTSKYPTAECSPYLTSDASTDVNCTTKTSDAIGRVTQDALSDGGIITRVYDINGNVTSMTDADGFTTTYNYDAFKRLRSTTQQARAGAGLTIDTAAGLAAGLTSTYGYDLMGNLTSKVERGLTTKFEYNSLGKVIAETRAYKAANVTTPLYKKYTYRIDGARTAESNFSYVGDLSNYASNAPKISTGTGTPTITDGNVQIFELDAIGNVIAECSKGKASDGTMLLEKVATYTYNGLNLRVSRDFNGHEAIYQAQRNPDGKFRLTTTNGDPLNPAGAMNTRVFTTWQYDLNKHLTYKADSLAADFSNPFNKFIYSYTDTGNVLASSRDVSVKIPAFQNDVNLGPTITLAATYGYVQGVYNSRDKVWQANVDDISADGVNTTGARFNRITQYGYFVDGAKSYATVLLWDGGGVATGTKGTQYFSYDKRGRETSRTDSDGAPDTRARNSSLTGVIGVGTGTATTPSVGDQFKALFDKQIAGTNGGTQPARPIVGTATITTTYGAGTKSVKIVDGASKCIYQQDTTLTLGQKSQVTKEWEWEPKDLTKSSDYVAVVCGIGQPSRQTTITYDASGNVAQQGLIFRDTGTHNTDFQVNTTANQTVTIMPNFYGQPLTEVTSVYTATTGMAKVPVYVCSGGYYLAVNNTDVDVTESYSRCDGTQASITVLKHSNKVVTDKASRVFDHYDMNPYNKTQTDTTSISHIYDAGGNGYEVGKAQTSTTTAPPPTPPVSSGYGGKGDFAYKVPDYQPAPDDSDGNYTFVTDSRGNRLKVFGGKYNNYIKRLDADGQPAMFFRWEGASGQPYAAYNDFRYSPQGEEVLSSTGGLIQGLAGTAPYTVKRDSNAMYSMDGDVQIIRKRVGDVTQTTNTYASSNMVRDPMYSTADGLNDKTEWSGVVLFNAVPSQGGTVLEAPTTPLSVTTQVDPSSVTAPNQGVPNIDPTPVTPPSGTTEPPSQTSASSSSTDTDFGVRIVVLATPSSTDANTFTVGNALTNPATNGANATPAQASFEVQPMNLEPPSSVLPASLSSLNALDVIAPQSVVPGMPSTGLGDPGAILPPNSSNTVPNVGSTPADGPGTVQAPTGVTSTLPPTVTNLPPTTIKPPAASGGEVKPLEGLVWIDLKSDWYAKQFQDFINASDANRKEAQSKLEEAIKTGNPDKIAFIFREMAFRNYASVQKFDHDQVWNIVQDLRSIDPKYANSFYDNLTYLLSDMDGRSIFAQSMWDKKQAELLQDAMGDIDAFVKMSPGQQAWWIKQGQWRVDEAFGREPGRSNDFSLGYVTLKDSEDITKNLYALVIEWRANNFDPQHKFDMQSKFMQDLQKLGTYAALAVLGTIAISAVYVWGSILLEFLVSMAIIYGTVGLELLAGFIMRNPRITSAFIGALINGTADALVQWVLNKDHKVDITEVIAFMVFGFMDGWNAKTVDGLLDALTTPGGRSVLSRVGQYVIDKGYSGLTTNVGGPVTLCLLKPDCRENLIPGKKR